MTTKRRARPKRRRLKPEFRVDVTRIEYLNLVDLVSRNAEGIKRLETAMEIQFTRTAELQVEVDALKRARRN